MKETSAKWGSTIRGVGLELADFFDQGLESYMPGINEVLHVETTNALQTNYSDFTDYTGFGYRDEGDNAKEQERHKGFVSSYIVDSMAGSVYVTQESIDDNEYSQALDTMRAQGRDSMRFRDKLGYQLFNQGFDNNNTEKGGFKLNWFNDTKPQFSVAHPSAVPGGSSQSNASANNIVLSEDNLEVAEIALEDQQQDNGELLDFAGTKTLNVPHNLRRTAMIIDETAQNVGTDYNDVNIYSGVFKIVASKYFGTGNQGSATAWFMTDDDSHKLHFIVREEPIMESDYTSRNRTYEFNVHSRGTAASKNWKATWASKGTGSGTYTA